ncbi:MAG: Tyrosine-specific transport protein [Chlamydiae bacterium]|nr:Tyrosine-specific transport protein [Chlamydiota bacterium]
MKKLFSSRLLGGILLIVGTTLGVGMLGFPVALGFGGFFPSVVVFILMGLLMLSTAFFFLDANLSIKEESNMVTMAEKLLGKWGKIVCWVIYLLLLYSLTAVFIAGSTPLLVEAIRWVTGMTLPSWLAPFSLPVLFGGFIYFGTRGVDLVNRLLMLGLVLSFILLVFFVPSQVEGQNLLHIDFPASWISIPVVITAFGYHIIIPSLVTYMNRDVRQLRKALLIGSAIPLFVFLLWQLLVLGAVPLDLLTQAFIKGEPATVPLAKVLRHPAISLAAKLFSFFAIVTSFVGVTLSLSDFLTDGFKIKRTWGGRILAIFLTFVPPLFFVFTYKRGFYMALQFAGAFVAILLVFLPAAMAWKLKAYQTVGRRALLIVVMALGLGIVLLDGLQEMGKLNNLISHYISKTNV